MTRPRLMAVLALVLLAAVVVAGQVTGRDARATARSGGSVAAVTSATLVCPGAVPSGSHAATVAADVAAGLEPPSQSSGTVTATSLVAKPQTRALKLAPGSGVSVDGSAATVISGSGSVAASLVADQVVLVDGGSSRALSDAQCVAPAPDWWFAGADGRVGYTDTLRLSNPSTSDVRIAVSLWDDQGPLSPPGLDDVRVAAGTTYSLPLANAAPDKRTLAIHVHSTSGAVAAAVFDRRTSGIRAAGSDWQPATLAPTRTAVVAGYGLGQGTRELVVANPGVRDATVGLKAVTTGGGFTPTGDDQIVIRSGRTKLIDLSRAFGEVPGGVIVTSDQPVVAEGLFIATASRPKLPDLRWQPAVAALSGPAAIANNVEPDGGHATLSFLAPQGASAVRIATGHGKSQPVELPAGRTVQVDVSDLAGSHPTDSALVVTVTGAGPVFGVRSLSFVGAHGPLVAAEPLVSLPGPIPLPGVQLDLGVSIR